MSDESMTVWSDDIDLARTDPLLFSLRAIAAQQATRRTSVLTARVMTEAADRIDALTAERDALQAKVDKLEELYAEATEDINELIKTVNEQAAKVDAIDALLADSSEREPTLGHYDDGRHDALYAVYLALHPEGDTPT